MKRPIRQASSTSKKLGKQGGLYVGMQKVTIQLMPTVLCGPPILLGLNKNASSYSPRPINVIPHCFKGSKNAIKFRSHIFVMRKSGHATITWVSIQKHEAYEAMNEERFGGVRI